MLRKIFHGHACAEFHKVPLGSASITDTSGVWVIFRARAEGLFAESQEVGAHLATGRGTMNGFDKKTKPLRESSLNCSRLVAAAGSLLFNWTDFGRLITKLP
jgi:hypothetical protein